MKYYVGDKVKVKAEVGYLPNISSLMVTPCMKALVGKTVEVRMVCQDGTYLVKESNFWWNSEMFESLPKPKETSIAVTITDPEGNLFEDHNYIRHAETSAETEKLYWSMINRYGCDSFFNEYNIKLDLWIDGRQVQEITLHSTEG